jgi:Transposase and inactivated derivatives
MLSFPTSVRMLGSLQPCDMRKSFDGVHAEVEHALGDSVKTGALFIFSNKRRNLLKILYFDGHGLWILAKRLERGAFTWPQGNRLTDTPRFCRAKSFPAQPMRFFVNKVDFEALTIRERFGLIEIILVASILGTGATRIDPETEFRGYQLSCR